MDKPPLAIRVGFIGLGVMGTPMASHLSAAGHPLHVFDIRSDLASHLVQSLGPTVRAEASPRDVAKSSDIVFTMLPDGAVVNEVVVGEKGLAQGFRPGSMLIDTSSSQPWLTQQTGAALAERDVAMIDAPVSGAQWGAESANLVFMVGGESADVDRARPLLARLGNTVFHLGALGCGHAMKCLNNLITAMTFSATTEGLVIGKRYGLDPSVMVDVLNASTGMSWMSQTHLKQRILSRSFDDPFKLELMLKDVAIANALAAETGASVPVSALGQQLWQAATRAAGEGASISELARWVERQSSIELTPGAQPQTDPAKSASKRDP